MDIPADMPADQRAYLERLQAKVDAQATTSTLLAEKVRTAGFQDVREVERERMAAIDARMAGYQEALRLADGILQIRNQPGWREFAQMLEGAHTARLRELEGAKETSQMMRLQGRCQELASICALVRQTEKNREAIAAEIERLQAEKRSIEQQTRPKESTQ